MKVAIVAFHFSPDESIGAVRPENWANWLASTYEVVVITRESESRGVDSDRPYRVLRPWSLTTRILEKFNNRRKQRRMRKAATAPVPDASGNATAKPSSGALVYRMPCLYDVWFLASFRAMVREKPDVVIATHSPYISLVAGWLYSLVNPGVKLWLDFRDPWTESHLALGVPVIRQIERWIENKALSRADVVSTVSKGIAETLSTQCASGEVSVVYNAPSGTSDFPSPTQSGAGRLMICYAGTIYPGWRDPTPLLELLKGLERSDGISPNQVQLVVASRNPGDLLPLAARHGASDYVNFLGAMTRNESIELQTQADVLLLLESPAPSAKGVLTGKVFEYLAAGKPILLIGPGPGSELHDLLSQHDVLITLEYLAEVLKGTRQLPKVAPVDYSSISRTQLLDTMSRLETR